MSVFSVDTEQIIKAVNEIENLFPFIYETEGFLDLLQLTNPYILPAVILYNNIPLLQYILRSNISNAFILDGTLLVFALKIQNTDAVLLLLSDLRVDPSAKNNFAIRMASRDGYDKAVALLLNNPRVDPSVEVNYAIRIASENGHDKVVALLLTDPRVDPSAEVNIAIRWASENGHDKVGKRYVRIF